MIVSESLLPIAALMPSLLAPIGIYAARSRPQLRESVTFLAAFLKLVIVCFILQLVWNGVSPAFTLGEVVPGVALALRVDEAGILFAAVASVLWLVTSLYSVGYMRSLQEHSQTRFYCFFSLSLFATIGVAFSANLLTLYLFYELLSLSTFPLVTHHQNTAAKIAGRKYLTHILGLSIALALPALIIVYNATGHLDFQPEGIIAGNLSLDMAGLCSILFLFGFAKAGVMPFHSWLPGAMVAPTPVSSLLHAVAVVKVGVFSIYRVWTGILGVDFIQDGLFLGVSSQQILCIFAGLTVVLSSLIALSQDGLKRRLAFSTIGQLGYIVLGTLLLVPHALTGALVHIVMHAFGKITLFFCAGAIYVACRKKNISELNGLGRAMPFTFGAFFVGSLSVIGLPPGGGLWSKLYLVLGSYDAELWLAMLCYLLSSLLGAAYLLPIVFRAFFTKPVQLDASVREVHWTLLLPILFTATVSILLFVYPFPVFYLAERFVGALVQ